MLTRKFAGLSVSSNAFAFAFRSSRRSAFNLYTTLAPAEPSSDLKKAIFDEARLLQQQHKSIPWYLLAAKYHLSIDALQNAFGQAEADAQKRQQQSALVTRAAERHFDSAVGQYDWEAIAGEVDLPLIECLDLFDASNSTIKPCSLIETNGGWSTKDMEKLQRFIATNYSESSAVDWKLAGAFMNVDSLECQRLGLGTFIGPINEVAYRRINEFRKSNLSWKEIHQHFRQYPNELTLYRSYRWFKAKLEGRAPPGLTAPWTDAERGLMKGLLSRHGESTTRSEMVGIIQRELPDRPLNDIRRFYTGYFSGLKAGYLSKSQMTRLRGLVAEYGEDWDRVGKALGILPSRARFNWIRDGGEPNTMTAKEARQLQCLLNSGVKAKEAARLSGAKSYRACLLHTVTVRAIAHTHSGNALSKATWAARDDQALLKMVREPVADEAAKWEQISKTLGRSIVACKSRARFLRRSRKLEPAVDDSVSRVTSEAQRQFELSGAVDWSQVSQTTGLGERECLELSQHDDGKAKWHYDPNTFSQSMADRMTSFIREHYPAPVPMNYRAVSNFMWIDMEDCIRIHDMLEGKFKWTKANGERAAKLWDLGLTLEDIARQLSPTLSASAVSEALKRRLSPVPKRKPVSTDELVEAFRLVDEYVGKYAVADIVAKIRKQLNLHSRCGYSSAIGYRISLHPLCKARLSGIDFNDVANRVAAGQTTVVLAAKELDVPYFALAARVRSLKEKVFLQKWSDEETRKLIDYVRGCDSKPSVAYLSKMLGTKSSRQCGSKIAHLRKSGVLA
ncbi:hypothetical protein GGH91_001204 [Coemansia sp. RSA 2671]|nr:hypothetical protein GGH91_001204 [Coemansia sp. RSA 2671]